VGDKTIFKRIIDHEIPAEILFEDELCLAFRDIHPQAPSHILVIPKKEIATLDDVTPADEGLIGHMFTVMRKLAADAGVSGGYRVCVNCGRDAGQEVFHLHFHLLGGRKLTWPPG
jgi:histidine triad (HIT) family protein